MSEGVAEDMTIRAQIMLAAFAAASFHGYAHGYAQASYAGGDTLELPAVVAAAGKTSVPFRDSPIGASVIRGKDIQARGARRLGDVLAEQTSLTVTRNQFGAGVQVQGLAPDYTLILVDGEPMVGRTGGVLDLDRITLDDVEQVEIIEGPSSSLYGSEALGGVINVVTRRPTEPVALSFKSRYGSNRSLDLGGGVESKLDSTELYFAADRMSSDGYDLTPAERGQTAPRYENYTLMHRAAHTWEDGTRLVGSARFLHETQRNEADYLTGDAPRPARDQSVLRDGNAAVALERSLSPTLSWALKGYAARYEKNSRLAAASDDSVLSATLFDQRYYKVETFMKADGETHALNMGGGGALESVRADYVAKGAHEAWSGFAFLQEDWKPDPRFILQTSARLDAHRDYAAHVSPRVAALYKPMPWLGIRASAGNGFKAPTTQELYLDFTNPQVGYTVFGATGARAGLERLREQGQIQSELRDDDFGTLRPENSWAFNAGAEIAAGKRLSARANVFRNNVRDLIESAPVAVKTNGQSVYTYFNLNRIHTEGVETDATVKPTGWLTLGAGYQFLVAEDDDVLSRIAADSVFKVGDNGRVRPVQRSEYGGLFNRSRHSANLKMDFDSGKPGFSASLRGIYHGRYGYGDLNGNGILDDDREYASGYLELNVTLTQKISRFASLQAGADNLLDRHVPAPTPTLPGRLLYAGLRLQYF